MQDLASADSVTCSAVSSIPNTLQPCHAAGLPPGLRALAPNVLSTWKTTCTHHLVNCCGSVQSYRAGEPSCPPGLGQNVLLLPFIAALHFLLWAHHSSQLHIHQVITQNLSSHKTVMGTWATLLTTVFPVSGLVPSTSIARHSGSLLDK